MNTEHASNYHTISFLSTSEQTYWLLGLQIGFENPNETEKKTTLTEKDFFRDSNRLAIFLKDTDFLLPLRSSGCCWWDIAAQGPVDNMAAQPAVVDLSPSDGQTHLCGSRSWEHPSLDMSSTITGKTYRSEWFVFTFKEIEAEEEFFVRQFLKLRGENERKSFKSEEQKKSRSQAKHR